MNTDSERFLTVVFHSKCSTKGQQFTLYKINDNTLQYRGENDWPKYEVFEKILLQQGNPFLQTRNETTESSVKEGRNYIDIYSMMNLLYKKN